MNKLIILLTFGLLSGSISGQKSIISGGAESITIAELRDHMFYLASDELEGRMTGTEGYNKAAQYCVTQFRQAGLSPICIGENPILSYYQEFMIDKYSPGQNNKISILKGTDKQTFSFEDNFIVYYGGPFETGELTGDLVFVGTGIRETEYGIDDYINLDVKGKWVVMFENLPGNIRQRFPQQLWQKYHYVPESRQLRVKAAKVEGAAGIIFISEYIASDRWKGLVTAFHDFDALSGLNNPFLDYVLPVVIIDSVMTSYLFSGQEYNPFDNPKESKSFELKQCKLSLRKDYSHSNFQTANVIGLVEGSDPILKNEFVTLTAHLDHMGIVKGEVMNGADDNASGSAGVLEIAEALVLSKPRRSIICILCAGEELGLLGSFYFSEHTPVSFNNIIANINLDMIGSSDTDVKGLAPFGSGRINQGLRDIISKVSEKTKYPALNWAYADTARYLNMSDHYHFHLKGIPSVFFFSGDNADIHLPTDDAEKIDYDFFQKSCQLVYEVVMELANGNISLRD
jgi:hypothetical protein